MRFLLDVCVASQTLHQTLVDLKHDVLSARDGYSNATDDDQGRVAHYFTRVVYKQ